MTDSISDNAHNYQLGYAKGLADGREEEKKRIIKEYGRSFNDGCGCCMFENLEEALKKEAK
jgi:hypothetical protein